MVVDVVAGLPASAAESDAVDVVVVPRGVVGDVSRPMKNSLRQRHQIKWNPIESKHIIGRFQSMFHTRMMQLCDRDDEH